MADPRDPTSPPSGPFEPSSTRTGLRTIPASAAEVSSPGIAGPALPPRKDGAPTSSPPTTGFYPRPTTATGGPLDPAVDASGAKSRPPSVGGARITGSLDPPVEATGSMARPGAPATGTFKRPVPGTLDPPVEATGSMARPGAPATGTFKRPVPGTLDPPVEATGSMARPGAPATGTFKRPVGPLDPAIDASGSRARPTTTSVRAVSGSLDPAIEASGARPRPATTSGSLRAVDAAAGRSRTTTTGSMRAVRPSAQTADILGLAAPPPTEPPKAPTPFQLPSWVPSVAGGAVAVALVVYVLASGAEALSTKTLDRAVARTATDAWLAAGEPGPVRTDDVAAAVDDIGQSVAAPLKAALGDRKARFVVVDDLQSVRTLSLPDGTVVVSTGLLLQLRSEAQVAAILAHALAHIANGDVDDTVFRLRADDEIASAASLREGVPAPRALISAMSDVAQSSFEIVEELEADRVMLEALGKAGWSNDGLNTFIADLISKGSRRRPAWLLQHPENGDRSEARVRARAEGRVNIPEFSTRIAGPLAVPPPSKATDTDKAGTEVAKDGARP
jgi:hypothetical protein